MPLRRIPPLMVQKLQKLVKDAQRKNKMKDLYRFLGRMPIIDHRKGTADRQGLPQSETQWAGRRVRQLAANRNHVGMRIVIKRTEQKAAAVEEVLRREVERHNQTKKPRYYTLLAPKIYPLGTDLIAMRVANAPNLNEMIGDDHEKTPRGQLLLKKWRKQFGITPNELKKAQEELMENTTLFPRNVLVAGYRNNQFVFVPLADLA